MIGFTVGRIVNNAPKIVRQIKKRKSQTLDKFGVDLREAAVSSMKTVPTDSPKTSSPGSPPFVRSGEPNLTTIRHAVNGDTVVAGPVLAKKPGNLGGPIPGILERGGTVMKKTRRNRMGQGRVIRYQVKARPFIYPAGMKALRKMQGDMRRRGIAR
jgi:hypothetical protein